MIAFLTSFSIRTWVRLGLAAVIAAALAWVVIELRAGAAAKAEADRLVVELGIANQAIKDGQILLDRRTKDLMLQVDLMARKAEREARDADAAAEFERRLNDFGPAGPVPPIIDRTIREVFP